MTEASRKKDIEDIVAKYLAKLTSSKQEDLTPNDMLALVFTKIAQDGIPDRYAAADKERRLIENQIITILGEQYNPQSNKAKAFDTNKLVCDDLLTHKQILENIAGFDDKTVLATYFDPFFYRNGPAIEFGPMNRALVLGPERVKVDV